MSERLVCPEAAREPVAIDSLYQFRRGKGQELISSPRRAYAILREAREPITDFYSGVMQRDPFAGKYYVERVLRGIALSAALFNGATFTMNYFNPVKAYNADSVEGASF